MPSSDGLPSVGIVAHNAGGVGGMERQIEKVAIGLADRGYPVTIYAVTCAFAGHRGVRWVRIPCPRPMSVRLPVFALTAGLHLLIGGRPDVLLTTGAIVPVPADFSVVHFCHHAYRHHHGHRAPARSGPLWLLNARLAEAESLAAERWFYRPRWSRCLLAVSTDGAHELERHLPGPIPPVLVAENGVDTETFSPDPEARVQIRAELGVPDGGRLLLFVGGDWGLKRLSLPIEALVHAPGWTLVVVGDGDIPRYVGLAARLGISHRVHFLGRRKDPRPYYAAADLLIQPSRTETFSLVLLEACAAGIGVLTTLRTGLAGELARLGAAEQVEASPAAIATRLNTLNSSQLVAMGRAGRDVALPRDWRFAVDRFETLVLWAASGRGSWEGIGVNAARIPTERSRD